MCAPQRVHTQRDIPCHGCWDPVRTDLSILATALGSSNEGPDRTWSFTPRVWPPAAIRSHAWLGNGSPPHAVSWRSSSSVAYPRNLPAAFALAPVTAAASAVLVPLRTSVFVDKRWRSGRGIISPPLHVCMGGAVCMANYGVH